MRVLLATMGFSVNSATCADGYLNGYSLDVPWWNWPVGVMFRARIKNLVQKPQSAAEVFGRPGKTIR